MRVRARLELEDGTGAELDGNLANWEGSIRLFVTNDTGDVLRFSSVAIFDEQRRPLLATERTEEPSVLGLGRRLLRIDRPRDITIPESPDLPGEERAS